jgi:hypothetical protein
MTPANLSVVLTWGSRGLAVVLVLVFVTFVVGSILTMGSKNKDEYSLDRWL